MDVHEHNHNHVNTANKKTLLFSLIIITIFMIVEFIGGYITNSLALVADAGHMFSDALSLFIALMAFSFSNKAANYKQTYGYKRFEILAAVINGVSLILISFYIIYEALKRFNQPLEIASNEMLVIAIIGLLVNVFIAWKMLKGADVKENLNMKSAYLHVISDMLGSVGAILAALCIIIFDWYWADSVASIIVAVLVLRSGYMVTKTAVHILMEGTPKNVDLQKVEQKILESQNIISLHDLHVWTITSGFNALTCHAVVDAEMTIFESDTLIRQLEHDLLHLNINHITIQLESALHQNDKNPLCNVNLINEVQNHHHQH